MMKFVGLVIESVPFHRFEEDAHDTSPALAFDLRPILSQPCDELANMDGERRGRRVDSGSAIPRMLLRAIKTKVHDC